MILGVEAENLLAVAFSSKHGGKVGGKALFANHMFPEVSNWEDHSKFLYVNSGGFTLREVK